jgi:pimeloyl-ACP methyl ester carboxylesterase
MNSFSTDCFGGLAPRRDQVQAGTTRLSFLEWGTSGAPLLLLHGITSSARSFWRVAPALAAQGYHVFALDMPGHGQSEETDDHRIDHIAVLVDAALRALALDRPALVGHSWGGATALVLASAIRPALARVVLIDPALRMDPARGAEALPRFLNGVGMPPEATLDEVRAANPDWHECDVLWKGEAFQQCRAEAVRGLFINSDTWDLTRRPAQVDMPLLLLVADPQHTVIAPQDLAAAEQALRPGLGRLVTVPGTNHNMLRGGYDVVMPMLIEWLGSPGLGKKGV